MSSLYWIPISRHHPKISPMHKNLSFRQSAVFVALLASGFLVTIYGIFQLNVADPEKIGWRWGYMYLNAFLIMTMLVATGGLWRGPRIAGTGFAILLILALGVIVPVAVVCVMALSAFALGRMLLRDPDSAASDCLLVGVAVFGTLFGLLAQVSVNYSGIWAVLFALPLVAGRHRLHELFTALSETISVKPEGVSLYLMQCAIVSAAMLHVLVGLMPEIGHDALAMHLFVPSYISYHHMWSFDAGAYVWAVMPMLVDWLYTSAYLFAGETGARLVNIGGILLLAILVHRLALWAGAYRVGAGWSTLLLLVTPLTFLESSSLFIEGMWSALVVGGTLALFRFLSGAVRARTDLMLAALLLGAALAAKAVTFTILPALVLLLLLTLRRWLTTRLLGAVGVAILLFVMVGSIPYLRAYLLTGNPIFPFFNAFFQSPLYPLANFSADAFPGRSLSWTTLYQITFDSGKYLEATAGAAGFQWLLLVVPALGTLGLIRHRRGLIIGLIGSIWLWFTFSQTAYLRYAFPTVALACTLAGIVLSVAGSSGRWVRIAGVMAVLTTLLLNLLHFDAGTYCGKINLSVITDARMRGAYLEKYGPLRLAVALVNELNHGSAPVAFFSAPLTAGLHADAFYVNWYNPHFQSAVLSAKSSSELGYVLARNGVRYMVVDENEQLPDISSKLHDLGVEFAEIGSISVRRLNDCFLYQQELLPSTRFEKGWHLTPGAMRLSDGGIQVTVSSPAYVLVSVKDRGNYHYHAVAHCAGGVAKGRLQVNWLSRKGRMLRCDIEVFDCSAQESSYSMEISPPSGAVQAVVYASAHEAAPVVFTSISFRK